MATTIQRKTSRSASFQKLSFELVAQMLFDLEGGESVSSVARRYGVSNPTVRYWKPYVGLSEHWLRIVRVLERENLYLEARLRNAAERLDMAKKLIKQIEPRAKRRSIYASSLRAGFPIARETSNEICGVGHLAGQANSRTEGDHKLVDLMRKYLAENPGYGFRKMFEVLLRDERCTRNHAEMLYREARLQRHWPRKKVEVPARIAHRIVSEGERDAVWSIDFLVDVLPNGRRFWVLSAIDEYSRECIMCKALFHATSKAVLGALEELRNGLRVPGLLRSDRGAQFVSHAYKNWTRAYGVKRSYSRPSTPSDNIYVERLNGTIRREVLDCYAFRSLAEVQRMLDDWRVRYNMARPHRSLHGLSPMQFLELYSRH